MGGSGKTPLVEEIALAPARPGGVAGRRQPRIRTGSPRRRGRVRPRRREARPAGRRRRAGAARRAVAGDPRGRRGEPARGRARGGGALRRHRRRARRRLPAQDAPRRTSRSSPSTAASPWGNGRLFPRGMLREPLSALRRADLLVVTNASDDAVRAAIVDVIRAHNRLGAGGGGELSGGRAERAVGPVTASAPRRSAGAGSWPSPDSARRGASPTRSAPPAWAWPGSRSIPTTTGSRPATSTSSPGSRERSAPRGSSPPRRTGCA